MLSATSLLFLSFDILGVVSTLLAALLKRSTYKINKMFTSGFVVMKHNAFVLSRSFAILPSLLVSFLEPIEHIKIRKDYSSYGRWLPMGQPKFRHEEERKFP
jgi:hypothetical protein